MTTPFCSVLRRLVIDGPHTRESSDASGNWAFALQRPIEVGQDVGPLGCVRDLRVDRADQGSYAGLCGRLLGTGQLGYEKHEVAEREVGGAREVDRKAWSLQ